MNFNNRIISLIETTKRAWNEGDFELFDDLLEDDLNATVEPVTVNHIFIEPKNIKGKSAAIDFMKSVRNKLPLKYDVEYDPQNLSKRLKYRKFFYEIKVWAYFECVISEYGKYKEFHITHYENVHAKKLTTLYVLRNVAWYKVKTLLPKSRKY